MKIFDFFKRKPVVIPDPTVQLQVRTGSGWKNVEDTTEGKEFRTVTTYHDGRVAFDELKV